MIKIHRTESECVSCELPCLGSACSRYDKVTNYYCDHCGERRKLYYFEGDELCSQCILNGFTVVEGTEDYEDY